MAEPLRHPAATDPPESRAPAPPAVRLRPGDYWRLKAATSERDRAQAVAQLIVSQAEGARIAVEADIARRYRAYDLSRSYRLDDASLTATPEG